ncbi:MAG: cell surface protein SprA [Gemmatimonadaceae bacterium]|nr:cell surface protein SprA [Gemmatimonadaceae bacterium]
MLLEDVFVEYLHGVKYTGGSYTCDPPPSARSQRFHVIHRWTTFCSFVMLVLASPNAAAQEIPRDTSTAPVVRIRLGDSLALRLPTVLSRAERESYRQAVQQIEAARATAFQQNMRSIIQSVWGQVAASSFATAQQRPAFATEPPDTSQRKVAARAGDIIAKHSDLALQLNGRLEFRGEKNQNERCAVGGFADPIFNCRSAFQPLIDFQFNARSGGVVAERLHVDVDYDTQREFDGSNNISVNYEGKGNELIQRIELGNVTFQPPISRFITGGIPSGNYGLQAVAKLGSARVKAILAQQKGNVVSDRIFTVGDRTLSAVDRRIEDHQFEPRRFFFTVPPRLFGRAYPNVDILDSRRMTEIAMALPDTLRPTRIFLYRLLIGGQPPNPSGPQFRILGDPRSRRGQVYERLREGIDYYVDPSQLWIALVRPLSLNNERLVVAYRVRVNGRDTINVTTGGTPDLEFRSQAEQFANMLWDPQVTPDQPAFEREIRSVYRVGGPEVRRQSVVIKVVTGTGDDQEKAVASTIGAVADTYLQLFGLAQRTNTSTFDIENRLWPRPGDPNFELSLDPSATRVIRDQFLVFPSLRPFAKNGLAGPVNPSNDTIYTTPSEYVRSAQRPQPVYHIRVRYQAEGSGDAGALMLGSVQVRPNSERLFVDGIPLVRGADYTVDYDLGRVSFVRPDSLFPRPRQVAVQFEENPVFAETPTSIFGATAEFPLARGSVNFTAISQTQNTTFNRPPLGFEPAASLVAGVTAQFSFDAAPLTALVSRLPFGQTSVPSRINVSGEFAASRPKPNSAGQAYIESFEGEGGFQVPLLDANWYYSSQPSLGRAIPSRLGADVLDLTRAATMAWQSEGLDARGDAVRYSIEDIDSLTNIIGAGRSGPEPLLWMTLYPLSIGGLRGDGGFKWNIANAQSGRRWRSIRTPLGATGSDLSRIESIEFWAQIPIVASRRDRNPLLILDFGDISENSVNFAPDTLKVRFASGSTSLLDSTFTGRKLEGFDRLDSERDPFSRAFDAGVNDRGLAGDVAGVITVVSDTLPGQPPRVEPLGNFATCRGGYSLVQILGDARSTCTVLNNRLDDEDVDSDNVLNLTSAERDAEQLRRYIVNLADSTAFNRVGRCAPARRTVVGPPPEQVCWVLFRIPFRLADDSLGAPLLRRIRALRMTMISGGSVSDNEFTQVPIARLRLTGAPWLKRRDTGIRGIGAEEAGSGYVNAGVIGTQDRNLSGGLSYESPPGVVDEPDTKRSNYQTNRVQINERSLRLTAGDLAFLDRAEAYFRFPDGEKNFMAYKELRLWARGVRNGWGEGGDLQFFVKIGRDPNNFYLYRTPLNGGPGRSAWLPEVRVDFQKLFRLRSEIQNEYLKGRSTSSCTGTDSALIARSPMPPSGIRFVACSDGYIAYTGDPGVSPPNLASVQELSVGMVRVGIGESSTPIAPGDTLELWVDDIRLGNVVDAAGYAGQIALSVLAGDFADIRMNVSRRDPHFRQLAEEPTFLTDNSVNVSSAFHLEKLLPRTLGLSIPFTVNYTSASIDPLYVSRSDVQGDVIEGLRTPRSAATSMTLSVLRAVPLADSRLAPLLNNLALQSTYTAGEARTEYENGRARNFTVGLDYNLSRALLPQLSRWSPAELHITSVYSRSSDRRAAFLKPASAIEDLPRQIAGLTSTWRNGTTLQMRPSKTFSGRLDFNSVRDLRGYGENTALGVVTGTDRQRLLFADTGIERERELQAGFNYSPAVFSWLRPRVDFGSSYNMLRDPNSLSFLRVEDSVGTVRLPRRLGSSQTTTAGVTLDLPRVAQTYVDSGRFLRRVMTAIQPIDVNYNRSLVSVFDQTPFAPPVSYQLAFGGVGRFRELGGRPATSAGLITQLSANHTVILPFGASVANRYQLINARNWTRRLDDSHAIADGTQIVFPDVALRWSMKPDRLRRVISSVGGSARAVQTRQINTRQPEVPRFVTPGAGDDDAEPGPVADRAETVLRSYPASLSVVFAGARPLSTTLGYAISQRRENRPGLSAQNASADMSVEISKPWAVPAQWSLRSDIRTRLSYQDAHGDNFVFNPLIASRESRLSDNGRRAFSFSADTDVAENLSSSFVFSRVESFDKNLNRRFIQTVLSAVLQLQFFAGDLK